MLWFTRWWVNLSIWDDLSLDEGRPTENAAFLSLRKQVIYGTYLRKLNG